ncbi:MAG TPA: hypothetical protein VKA85_01415 [Candidatus Limnocylindrales bacterium]|nr:hypothetical protein [Candidatus Limnocylindrales bacterium]
MPRTTIDLDAAVLRELKRRQRTAGRSLGQLASELLASALKDETPRGDPSQFGWDTQPMGAKVDLRDKEAVRRVLDEE